MFTGSINYIAVALIDFIAIFADDTKISNSLICPLRGLSLQRDLKRIVEWSDKWKMPV